MKKVSKGKKWAKTQKRGEENTSPLASLRLGRQGKKNPSPGVLLLDSRVSFHLLVWVCVEGGRGYLRSPIFEVTYICFAIVRAV